MRALDPRLLREAPPARRFLWICAALAAATAVAIVAQAALLAHVVAGAFLGHRALGSLWTPLCALAGVSVARGALGWAFETGGSLAAAGTVAALRRKLLAHLVAARPGGLGELRAGEVAAAVVDGGEALEPYFAKFLPQLVLGAVVPPVLLAWVGWHDLTSLAVLAVALPTIPLFGILIGRSTEHATEKRRRTLALLSAHFLDVVRGLPTLRAYRRGAAQAEEIARRTDEFRRETMATLRIAFLSAFVLELAASLGTALVAVEIGIRLADGRMALEPALAILVLAPELFLPWRNGAVQFHASADGLAAARRLFELADLEPAVAATATGAAPDPALAPLRLEGVSASYPGRGRVLEGVSLELAPGERVAVFGPSGAGKSTLLSLLLRFRDPDAGRILVGGDDVLAVDPDAWRRRLAWVPQRPTLAGMVLDVDPRTLSPGEARRVALRRALDRDAPLLLLDEPTAHLDAATAANVLAELAALPRTASLLVATHDEAVLAVVDRALELRDGRLRDLGRRAA
ncbi:MAG TPA: ATP-binding cassette domain-containing protein [Gaiellaceae bacterium]|nr:ATP-binding cassette domain-containing protein [Gaiellaceae bacterium]